MTRTKTCLIAAALFGALCLVPLHAQPGKGNPNPGVAPINSNAHGRSYGEWVAAWWTWAASIPADQNPIVDPTGEFGQIGQRGPVWFLAGAFGGTVERSLAVPAGKALFFPLFNSLWWAPDDLQTAADLAVLAGLDPSTMSDEELIRFIAAFQVDYATSLTCTVDGRELRDLFDYRASSPAFLIEDTDLIDDLGAAISQPNAAIGDGYWLLLNPLTPGAHTIRFTVVSDHPVFGPFSLDVTYHLAVTPGKK
jgi:hypothetical protein